jgi:pimeloyl-ACP methyl ester carboxylesterase
LIDTIIPSIRQAIVRRQLGLAGGNMSITVREIPANGMAFRCREAAGTGEPVLLLHGFPETSHMWLPLMDRLHAKGYRCLAPDQRGYSPGARPEGADHYRYIDTASDALALADAWGADRFHLIGHDWGAGCGWSVVAVKPERVLSWTALSVPHVAAFGRAIRTDPDQQQKSQYVTFFQQPGAAEALFAANDYAALKGIWSKSSPEEVQEYLSVFKQPGALTTALNWYRGSRGIDPHDPEVAFGPVATPTLMIWGNEDMAIGRTAVAAAADYMKGPYRFVELDAGHWLMQEAPDRVADEVMVHLARNSATKTASP